MRSDARPLPKHHPSALLVQFEHDVSPADFRFVDLAPRCNTSAHPADGLADNCRVTLEFDGALAMVASSALQPGAHAYCSLEIVGTNGIAILRPIERPTLVLDLAKAAGPFTAGKQTIPLPNYRRYAQEFADLASAIHEDRSLGIPHEQELLVEETILQCCGMLPA